MDKHEICWYCQRGLHWLCPAYIVAWQGTCDCSHTPRPHIPDNIILGEE